MMNCPRCHRRGLDWSPRCDSLLCLYYDCNYSLTIQDRDLGHSSVAMAITTGSAQFLQTWIDTHKT